MNTAATKTKHRPDKAHELNEQIKRLASECRLDSWTALVKDTAVPGDIYPALSSGRPELIALIQPRDLTAAEAKVLFDIIASLIGTNIALKEHAQQLALFTKIWADAFKQLESVGDRVQRFAQFQHDAGEDEEE